MGSDLGDVGAQSVTAGFQSTLPVWGATITDFLLVQLHNISIHAPRVGSDKPSARNGSAETYFNPRSPCGERRPRRTGASTMENFNPRSPCGERPIGIRDNVKHRYFNPRSPCGERPPVDNPQGGDFKYFNPRSPCGERPGSNSDFTKSFTISIHAPRVGSDLKQASRLSSWVLFQSTLPVWGATTCFCGCPRSYKFQSTLPVWGATPIS